jgi:hypothetical protein
MHQIGTLVFYGNKHRTKINSCITGTDKELNSILKRILKKYSPQDRRNIYWRVI